MKPYQPFQPYFETTEGKIFNFLTSWWFLIPAFVLYVGCLLFLVYSAWIDMKNRREYRPPAQQQQQQLQQPCLPEKISVKAYVALGTLRASPATLFVQARNRPQCELDYRRRVDLLKRHADFFSCRSYPTQKLNHPFLFLHNAKAHRERVSRDPVQHFVNGGLFMSELFICYGLLLFLCGFACGLGVKVDKKRNGSGDNDG